MFLFFIMHIIFIFKSREKLYIDIKEIILSKRNKKISNNNISIIKKKKHKRKIKHKELEKNNISNCSNSGSKLNKKNIEIKNITNDLMLDNDIKNKNILEYKDYELNSLSFESALIQDKRNLLQYYISSIKIIIYYYFHFYQLKIIIQL